MEGDWTLVDAEGKEIASSKSAPSATLKLSPLFYAAQYTQLVGEVLTRGKKGEQVRQTLRVSAKTGKIAADLMDREPVTVVPFFDRKPPTKDKK